jgi:uncharacterized protein YkwD
VPVRRRALLCATVLCFLIPASAGASASLGRQVLRGINVERHAHGLPPLRMAGALGKVAGSHTRFMARVGRLQHESADGTSATTRIRRAMRVRRAGEAIALATDARAIVRSWMASPPHRKLILSRSYRVIGVGVVRGTYSSYRVLYATADLGA